MPSTPWIVFSTIGKNAPSVVMNTMLDRSVGQSMMLIGTHATAGIGRNSSMGGNKVSSASPKRPMSKPSPTPSTVAIAKPSQMRSRLARMCT